MEHRNVRLIRELYEASNDVGAIRSILDEDVIWCEPESEHTGDLRGPDAVLAMIEEARRRTGGTFSLVAQQIVANGEHAVAMSDWSPSTACRTAGLWRLLSTRTIQRRTGGFGSKRRKRTTGFEPATSSLGSWRSTN